ncbi:putative bifunctional diguanylate cyclase/phosphodiesterase [Deinococcus hopiensis]|uniref:Diguanylate cyclase (GGDEF) domain-containing protein n=1 Tax=Deinococcus hopiensis KR-140 TaxID=695939 RepID=A0A1W1UY80_9DEIO|nr:EAL domain-containing protein [Deinococcus hopiensis]SMB85920.1 diguanylate cyclase (GGDEF) domain-containing protein [Deinococcus hopiensis KR-140]
MDPRPPSSELDRLERLSRYDILDTPPEEEFDRITRLARQLLQTPIAILNFVGRKRTWLKSHLGTNVRVIDRKHAICAEAIKHPGVFTIADLQRTPQFAQEPMLVLGARSYAGAPLTTPDGFNIGTIAVFDHHPRVFTAGEQALLQDLAAIVIDALELRRAVLHWQAAQAQSHHMAYHDPLTRLPNRRLLMDRIAQALHQAERRGTPLGILVVDLDGFKLINDSLGHAAGDAFLITAGHRLCEQLHADDTVARVGGDEFVILLPELQRGADAAHVADKIQQALEEPFVLEGQTLEVSGCIGISLYPGDGQDAETLLRAADTAMYTAKAAGKGECRFYTQDMTRAANEKLSLRQRLVQALIQGEFRLHYQPQVELASGRVVGAEALLRWPQADGTLLPPDHFIPRAEETGLIVPIGRWVLREACTQWMRWQANHNVTLDLSVNVSVRQWEQPHFLDEVREVLRETGFPPERLILEITESALLADPEDALALTAQLSDLGVGVALDDYGKGFSNLYQLQRLSVSHLKLDRAFIQSLPGDRRARAIAQSAVTLASGLDALTIGEGIEVQEQLDALLAMGCPLGQGFHLGRPVPPEEFQQRHLMGTRPTR